MADGRQKTEWELEQEALNFQDAQQDNSNQTTYDEAPRESYTPEENSAQNTTVTEKAGTKTNAKRTSGLGAGKTYEQLKATSTRTATPRTGYSDDGKAKQNPLSSVTNAQIMDLICEGPIEGLADEKGQSILTLTNKDKKFGFDAVRGPKSIFFDDTPIKTKAGHLNFRRFGANFSRGNPNGTTSSSMQGRTIAINKVLYPNNRWLMARFPSETLPGDNPTLDAKRSLRSQFAKSELDLNPITHTIVDKNATMAVVSINIHALTRTVTGKRSSKVIPHELSFLIYAGSDTDDDDESFWENPVLIEFSGMKYANDPTTKSWAEQHGTGEATNVGRKSRLMSNDTGGFFVRRIRGLATADYVFETVIHFPPNIRGSNRIIRVSRIDHDADMTNTDDQRVAQSSFRSVTEIVPYRLSYPNSAIVTTTFDSKAYSQIPKRNYLLKLQKIQVPSNYLPDVKQYIGNWDGRFKAQGTLIQKNRREELLADNATVFTRAQASISAKDPSSFASGKGFEINSSTKKFGSGSLRFKDQGDNPDSSDKVIRVYDGGRGYKTEDGKGLAMPFSNWNHEVPWAVEDLGLANFGGQNFTIEFYVKISATELKKVYNLSGATASTDGIQGVNKIILASDNNNGLGIINSGTATGELSREEQMKHLNLALAAKAKYGGSSGILGGGWKISVSTNPVGVLYFESYVSHAAKDYVRENETNEKGQVSSADVGIWDEEAYGSAVTNAQDNNEPIPKRVSYERNVVLTADISGANRIADGDWHHVAVVRNGDQIKLYVDGATEDSASMVDKKGIYGVRVQEGEYTGAGELQIGGSRTPYVNVGGTVYDSTFVGYLDELHIANSALFVGDTIPHDTYQRHGLPIANITTKLYMPFDVEIKDEKVDLVDINQLYGSGINPNLPHLQWTDNPAWIFYDLAVNSRYGMGKYGVSAKSVDKWSLYQIGKYCDELVRTGFPSMFQSRVFEFVDDDFLEKGYDLVFLEMTPPQKRAGQRWIRIKNFNNQAEFQREFPEGSVVNIHDLDDNKTIAYQRQIKYLRTAEDPTNPFESNVGSEGTQSDSTTRLLSYQANPESSGDAIVQIQDVISVEEAVRLDENLTSVLLKLQDQYPLNTDRELIFTYMQSPKGMNSLTKEVFDIGSKVNETSTSGKVCSELSDDYPFLEPRFTANIYIDGVTDGIRVLNDIAAIFRGITYYAAGKIVPTFDKDREPLMLFTNSNVFGGSFTYGGSSKSDRFTVCKVRFNDKKDKYKQRIEFIEDPVGVIKYGYNEKDLAALGCTSRGQARRLGRWFLYSAQHETETVNFTTSKMASFLMPGDVIKIADKNRVSQKSFGTIVGFPENEDGKIKIKVDAEIDEKYIGEKITISISRKFNTVAKLDKLSDHISVTRENTLDVETSEISDEEIADLRKSQLYEFTVKNVELDTSVVPNVNTVLELEENEEDIKSFGKIKIGAPFSIERINDEIKIKETLYRIINITQSSGEEYDIEGLEYNKSKHETVDFFKELEDVPQESGETKVRPSKMTTAPRINLLKSEDPQSRKLLVSWDHVSPKPYAYRIILHLVPNSSVDWATSSSAGSSMALSDFVDGGIRLEKTVRAETDDGETQPSNVAFNLQSYSGEVVVTIYTVDEEGNVEVVYN